MKKLLIYLSIIIGLFVILYVVNQQSERTALGELEEPAQRLYQTDPGNLKPSTRNQLNDPNYQNIVLRSTLDEQLQAGEDLFVYFFSPECVFCVESTPIVNEIAGEEGIDILQLNVLEDQGAFHHYGIDSTPTLVYFRNGEEFDRFVGGISDPAFQDLMRQFMVTYGGEA